MEFFHRCGKMHLLDKGQALTHGGDTGEVALLVDGLVSFSFVDVNSTHHIFALVLPDRAIGDLDALNPLGTNVLAECIRPSRVLTVTNEQYRAFLRESVQRMELYADLAILKEECELEGTFANFTLDLDARLRILLYALYASFGIVVKPSVWYPCPLALTVTEFAQIVAANRSWVSTKFSEWSKLGLIRKTCRTIECQSELFAPIHDWMKTNQNALPHVMQ